MSTQKNSDLLVFESALRAIENELLSEKATKAYLQVLARNFNLDLRPLLSLYPDAEDIKKDEADAKTPIKPGVADDVEAFHEMLKEIFEQKIEGETTLKKIFDDASKQRVNLGVW